MANGFGVTIQNLDKIQVPEPRIDRPISPKERVDSWITAIREDGVTSAIPIMDDAPKVLAARLSSDMESTSDKISYHYIRLAGVLKLAAEDKKIHVVLCWPFPTNTPLMAHALASLYAYSKGRGNGLRTLIWPAKRNCMVSLDGIQVDLHWLATIATRWQTAKRSGDPLKFTKSCFQVRDEKDSLFISLNNSFCKIKRPEHLSLREVLPSFPSSRKNDRWGHPTEHYCRRIREILKPRRGRSSIPDYCRALSDPMNAPDAVFRLHPDLNFQQMLKILGDKVLNPSEGGMAPDVALLDLRSSTIRHVDRWRGKTFGLVDSLQRRLSFSPLGMVVLVNDPLLYGRLLQMFKTMSSTTRKLQVYRHEFLNESSCPLYDHSMAATQRSAELPDIQSKITDRVVVEVADIFFQIARELPPDLKDGKEQLLRAGYRLLRLSKNPVGTGQLKQWLVDSSPSAALQERSSGYHLWEPAKRDLGEIMTRGMLLGFETRVEEALGRAQTIVDNLKDSTQVSKILLDEVKSETGSLAVACEGGTQVNLLYHLFENLPTDLQKPKIFQVQSIIKGISDCPPCDRLILLDGPSVVQAIFTMKNLPRKMTFLLGNATTARACNYLRAVIACNSFRPVHRLATLLLKKFTAAIEHFHGGRCSAMLDSLETKFIFQSDEVDVESKEELRGGFRVFLAESPDILLGANSSVYILDEGLAPPIKRIKASSLAVGDQIILPPSYCADALDERLRDNVAKDLFKSEGLVRRYLVTVEECLDRKFGIGPSRNREILAAIKEKHPECASEITPCMIGYWTRGIKDKDKELEELSPNAARKKKHFRAFAETIGIPDPLIDLYWIMITSFRCDRQKAGRMLSNLCMQLVFEPESVELFMNLPGPFVRNMQRETLQHLFEVTGIKELK